MASLQKNKDRYTLQFSLHGKRITWRLGSLNGRTAASFKFQLESLVESLNMGQKANKSVLAWIDGLTPMYRDFLVRHGLVEEKGSSSLGKFLSFAMDKHYSGSAKNTVRNMSNVQRQLIARFGDTADMESITKGDIEIWKRDLIAEKHSDANVASYLEKSRRFFNLAVDHEILQKTPFRGISIPSCTNVDRVVYVDSAKINQLLSVCDVNWKALVCLSRYTGLRCPSDIKSLKWAAIDFDRKRILSDRQKTSRTVEIPMQPEVESALKAMLDVTGESEYVFKDDIRLSGETIYKRLKLRVIKAGLTPWPRLTTNLRVSMGVDWKNAGIPHSTYSVWLDHSEAVQKSHYEHISDAEFDLATNMGGV